MKWVAAVSSPTHTLTGSVGTRNTALYRLREVRRTAPSGCFLTLRPSGRPCGADKNARTGKVGQLAIPRSLVRILDEEAGRRTPSFIRRAFDFVCTPCAPHQVHPTILPKDKDFH